MDWLFALNGTLPLSIPSVTKPLCFSQPLSSSGIEVMCTEWCFSFRTGRLLRKGTLKISPPKSHILQRGKRRPMEVRWLTQGHTLLVARSGLKPSLLTLPHLWPLIKFSQWRFYSIYYLYPAYFKKELEPAALWFTLLWTQYRSLDPAWFKWIFQRWITLSSIILS